MANRKKNAHYPFLALMYRLSLNFENTLQFVIAVLQIAIVTLLVIALIPLTVMNAFLCSLAAAPENCLDDTKQCATSLGLAREFSPKR
jgi:hypothetical protein